MAETKCKYYKQKKQVSYDGGVTWQDVIPYEYQKGELYEYESADCGSLVVYRWVNMDASTDYYCEGTTKYYKQKRQVSYDGGQTWRYVSPAEYQKGGVAESQSTDCGYVPPVTQYRWIKSDDTICVETLYRWINMDASTDYYCEGTTKYYKQKQQISYDEGQTWRDVTPAEYQKGGVAEAQSTDCGYIPPTPTDKKLVATYNDGTTRTVPCNDTPVLRESEVRREGYVYSAITSLVIGDCVTSIASGACVALRSLTSVTIPNSVTTIGRNTFSSCVSLPTITLPTGLASIENQLFDRCISLTGLTIPNSVTSIGFWSFEGCTSLKNIVIPNNVTTIGGSAFSGCTSLSSVTFGSGVTSIGDKAFYECSGLTSIVIPDSVTSIGMLAFNGCSGITNVSVGSGLTTIPSSFMARNPSLTSVTLSEGTARIDQAAFQLCTGLTSVTIPSSVNSIEGQAFYGCSGLTSITCLGTTPPSLVGSQIQAFDYTNNCPIYVPAESVSYYKIGSWDKYADRIQPIPSPEPIYENEFMFSNHSTSYHVTAGGAGESFNIDIISYVNGVKTDSYSLVEKTTWIQYDSHTAESFSITVGWNSTSRRRSGYITLRQDQTNKEITLDVTQL